MIDTESPAGEREIEQRRCEWCRHFIGWYSPVSADGDLVYDGYCALGRPLVPCEHYGREPGADG